MVDPMSVTISKQLNRPRRMVDMKFLPDPCWTWPVVYPVTASDSKHLRDFNWVTKPCGLLHSAEISQLRSRARSPTENPFTGGAFCCLRRDFTAWCPVQHGPRRGRTREARA